MLDVGIGETFGQRPVHGEVSNVVNLPRGLESSDVDEVLDDLGGGIEVTRVVQGRRVAVGVGGGDGRLPPEGGYVLDYIVRGLFATCNVEGSLAVVVGKVDRFVQFVQILGRVFEELAYLCPISSFHPCVEDVVGRSAAVLGVGSLVVDVTVTVVAVRGVSGERWRFAQVVGGGFAEVVGGSDSFSLLVELDL